MDIDRPLYRCYTSGSTGPSKQVIHSANTMLSIICQMNFYGSADGFRPNWLVTCLPPSLVAVVVSMVLLPMASNKLMIMDPFVFERDVDLEVMRYKANNWPQLPLFAETMMRNGRVPMTMTCPTCWPMAPAPRHEQPTAQACSGLFQRPRLQIPLYHRLRMQ